MNPSQVLKTLQKATTKKLVKFPLFFFQTHVSVCSDANEPWMRPVEMYMPIFWSSPSLRKTIKLKKVDVS